MWGWSVQKDLAFSILDGFYEAGHRFIDTATNYPINKDPAYFKYAESVLSEWIRLRKPQSLSIIMKIGSLSNDGAPTNDLSPDFIANSAKVYKELFGPNLHAICIHWDNRDDPILIKSSLEALLAATAAPTIWLSGIKNPEAYNQAVSGMDCRFNIQVKHNLFYSDISRYQPLHGRSAFYAYGINAGGVGASREYAPNSSARLRGIDIAKYETRIDKLKEVVRRSEASGSGVSTLNELALLQAQATENVKGIIIGPANKEQLAQTLSFFQRLERDGAKEAYGKIIRDLNFVS